MTSAGGTPAGTVQIYKGSKLLGTGTLGADGKVTIKITKKGEEEGQEHADGQVPRNGGFLASQATSW